MSKLLRRPRGLRKPVTAVALATAVAVTASGCVTVHGEREVLPAATKAEAARALKDFTAAYNKADKAYDASLDEDHVTGALGAIDAAKLKAGHVNHPDGNPNHSDLELSDAEFTIPKKAGWPRWFVADTKANRGGDFRWMLVFTRGDVNRPWQVSYLTLMAPGDVPEFKKDKDGWAQPVSADAAGLAVAPGDMSRKYATYLKDGGDGFAPGRHTSQWRTTREKNASRPGLARQYVDEPMASGDYAPLGLRTADGGALVFFATHHYEKQTASKGLSITVDNENVKALMTGDVKQSLTLERVSNQIGLEPAGGGDVEILTRLEGLTGAKGS
ncbi:hypothetical protein [Streptomyces sp. NPDC048641]|uniref:hypothetical protein n=1 Tax=unclassified Streptomyces TaxID=2593676 RepID=UPI0034340259